MIVQQQNYFLTAAIIAAELDKATKIAKKLSLTASNARAIALRAGEAAAGFKPLTEFIDRLANLTSRSSNQINTLAGNLSVTAANKFRTDIALKHFDKVYSSANKSPFISSLDVSYNYTSNKQRELFNHYLKQLKKLSNELEELKAELRTAVVLATLSRVEASQAGIDHQNSLNDIANNVEGAAKSIKKHIEISEKLVKKIRQES